MDENPVPKNEIERTGKNNFFNVLTRLCHFPGAIPMVYPYGVLLNDGSFVKVFVYKMCSGADYFYTTSKSLVIRAGTFKSG